LNTLGYVAHLFDDSGGNPGRCLHVLGLSRKSKRLGWTNTPGLDYGKTLRISDGLRSGKRTNFWVTSPLNIFYVTGTIVPQFGALGKDYWDFFMESVAKWFSLFRWEGKVLMQVLPSFDCNTAGGPRVFSLNIYSNEPLQPF